MHGSRRLAGVGLFALALTAHADPTTANDVRERPTAPVPFAADVYRARRARVLAQLKKGVALLQSTPRGAPEGQEQDPNFFYLTGLFDERDAALLLAPERSDNRELLFVAVARPERDRWTGYRALLPSRAVEQRVGFEHVRHSDELPWELALQTEQWKQLDWLGNAVPYDADPPRTLDVYDKAVKRVPGAKIENMHHLIERLRMVKEPRELEKIQRATDITVAAHLEAWRRARPGMHEWEVKQIVEDMFRKGGARRLSYPSIVGGGPDGCVLHYPNDDRVIEDGELVLIDAGAEYDHYATDVTRTFPVSGHFSPEQRAVYEVVLKAQNAALAKVRPGVTWDELQRAAEKVITDAGYYEYFIHGLGHHVGLDVHDLGLWSRYQPIAEGSVITLEPGIYIPGKKLGVRIEDMVLVTKSGGKLLSSALPRDPDAIEKIMSGARR